MAVRLAPATSGALAPSRDRSLQDVRRLDWRFLLPEPRLGRVAYLGPEDGALLAALREWSETLTVVPAPDHAAHGPAREASFDLVVAPSPGSRTLAYASALLRPGGWLYCELARPALLASPRAAGARDGVRGAPHAARLLHQLGFHDVEAHWHHPSFERCAWMVPMRGATALTFFLARARGGLVSPLVTRIAARILGAAAVARLLPCVSVVARRREAA